MRCSLVGNSFQAVVVAFLIGHLLVLRGLAKGPVAVEAAWGSTPFAGETEAANVGDGSLEEKVVRHYHRLCIYRGSDVRLATGTLLRPGIWPRQSFPAKRWVWRTILSFGQGGAHINVLELKAALATFRWRLRKAENVRTRVLHLMDSQVSISVSVKGRSSSGVLNMVLRKMNALMLAGGLVSAYGYVNTKDNPADRPSRWPPKSKH